jgi:Flp pilus assembly protein TadB
MQLLAMKEAAENKAVAEAEEKRKQEAEALAAREQEIAEAKAQTERAERIRREVEAQAIREQKRSRTLMLVVGVFLLMMLAAILFGLMPSSR